jgi:addiction module HigA family antidote
VPANRIPAILNGTRALSADTALRLAHCFRTSPEFWLNLQVLYDLEVARRTSAKSIAKSVKPLPRAAA